MKRAPNLLVIMSDEHQSRALSCAGHPIARTPHLDALAARGVRFTNAYTPSPICVPARAAFATGRYVHDIRLWDNAMPYIGEPRGWGHALQAQGTRVESVGKLHYRYADDDAGFDVEHMPMQVVDGVGMVWGSIRREHERVRRPGRMLGDYIGPGTSAYTRYDEAVTARTCEWIEDAARRRDAGPWCLYVGLVAPHFPLVVPQPYVDLYPEASLPPAKLHPRDGYVQHAWVARQDAAMSSEGAFADEAERLMAMRCYYGLCSFLDDNVGRIVDALAMNALLDETTVIYTSDHGDNVGARGLWGKSNLYEEAAAVPMVVAPASVDATTPRGTTCATPVSLIDVAETIAVHFGAIWPGERPGASLYDVAAAAPEEPERIAFSEYHAVGAVSGAFMLRKGRYKYIEYVGFEPELFDLEADPEETSNVAADASMADVLASLREALREVCDPQAVDAQAFADQDALIERHGGREAASRLGASAATPVPGDARGAGRP